MNYLNPKAENGAVSFIKLLQKRLKPNSKDSEKFVLNPCPQPSTEKWSIRIGSE